jgi:hypothetical protein
VLTGAEVTAVRDVWQPPVASRTYPRATAASAVHDRYARLAGWNGLDDTKDLP